MEETFHRRRQILTRSRSHSHSHSDEEQADSNESESLYQPVVEELNEEQAAGAKTPVAENILECKPAAVDPPAALSHHPRQRCYWIY